MALKTGELLNNRFEIKRQVGHGGFSVVYLAYDRRLRDNVALKIFDPESVVRFGDLQVIRKRFVQEAQITRQLNNDHIITIHDLDPSDELPFIVMPYLPDTLEDRLEQLTIEEAVRIMLQICDGLDYAHRRQVVHCDIKPNNILFDHNGKVKITDFGIAHVPHEGDSTGSLTTTMFGAGTILYMPPEQLEGQRTDPRIDVYALGALFYQMLTRGHYYLDFDLSGTTQARAENISRIFKARPTQVHLEKAPKALADITLQALSKRPQDRYANAGEMLEAIQEYQSLVLPKPVVRLDTTVPIETRKAPRRIYLISALTGIMLIVGAIGVSMWNRFHSPSVGVAVTSSPMPTASLTSTFTPPAPTVAAPTATLAIIIRPTFTVIPSVIPTLTRTRIPTLTRTATPTPRPLSCPGNQVWSGGQCECPSGFQWIPDAQWCIEKDKGGDGWRPPSP